MKIYIATGTIRGNTLTLMSDVGVSRILISYANVMHKDISVLPFEDIMLDSGAFSIHNSGAEISLNAYTLWLEIYLKKHPNITTYIVMDDISDWKKTKLNQAYMEKQGLKPMPVFHQGEPLEELDWYCERYEYVGLSGFARKTLSQETKQKYWEYAFEHYPKNRFHLLGCTTMTTIFKYQPFSMDSSTWTTAVRFGDLACYKNGVPGWFSLLSWRDTGFEYFFTDDELNKANLRGLLHWESLEWLKNLNAQQNGTSLDNVQGKLI